MLTLTGDIIYNFNHKKFRDKVLEVHGMVLAHTSSMKKVVSGGVVQNNEMNVRYSYY